MSAIENMQQKVIVMSFLWYLEISIRSIADRLFIERSWFEVASLNRIYYCAIVMLKLVLSWLLINMASDEKFSYSWTLIITLRVYCQYIYDSVRLIDTDDSILSALQCRSQHLLHFAYADQFVYKINKLIYYIYAHFYFWLKTNWKYFKYQKAKYCLTENVLNVHKCNNCIVKQTQNRHVKLRMYLYSFIKYNAAICIMDNNLFRAKHYSKILIFQLWKLSNKENREG